MFAYFWYIFISILLIILMSAFKVLREYERGVIFFLGRFYGVKGPRIDYRDSRYSANGAG